MDQPEFRVWKSRLFKNEGIQILCGFAGIFGSYSFILIYIGCMNEWQD